MRRRILKFCRLSIIIDLTIALAAAVIIFAGFGTGANASGVNSATTAVTNFREVPGVTAEEIAAIEKIQATRKSLSYASMISTEAFAAVENLPVGEMLSDAEIREKINSPTTAAEFPIDGFTKLYCEYLSELFGVEFKLRFCGWDEIINGLATHDVDFTGELTRTPEREKIYLMTDAIVERLHSYFRLVGAERFDRIGESRPVRLLFLSDSITEARLAPHLTFPYEKREVGDYDEAYELLKSGAADAFVEETVAEEAFDIYGDVIAEPTLPPLLDSVSLTTQNPELAPIISVMQKVLQAGGNRRLSALYNQGDRRYRRHKFWLRLTPDEREYIRRHRDTPIPIVMEPDNYPGCFYNGQEKIWSGIVPDVLAKISELTDLQFERINDENTYWSAVLKMLTDNQAALISELLQTPERVGKFLWADTPYCYDRFALLSRVEFPNLNFNEVLYARVGLIADAGYTVVFKDFFPNHIGTITYDDTSIALDALERGEIDLVMGTQNMLLLNTNYREKPGFKINLLFDNVCASWFGFNLEQTVLRDIVSKAQKFVDCPRIVQQWTGRVFDYRARMHAAQRPWMIAGFVLLTMIIALICMLLIRRREEKRNLEATVLRRTAELAEQTRLAQTALQAKTNFLANMSHEMRTPMNAILGMTTIYKTAADSERKDYCIGKIETASTHLLGVIDDVLNMSKIEAGKIELSENDFSLERMLRQVADAMIFRFDEKHQEFDLRYDSQLPAAVNGDEQRLAQVITNLLNNAVKFTPAGGKISLTVAQESATDSEVVVKVVVNDSGIGISPEQQAKLFSSFSQASSDSTRKFGGAGLGLAISKHFVELMSGKIWIDSELGKGATFSFTARLLRAKNPVPAQLADDVKAEDASADNFADYHLLVAEDVDINREILATLLEETQIEIDFAFDGADAVKKFAAAPERYDIIFMDMQMPVLDGYDATRQIRALPAPQAKTIPIIAMTANVFKEDVENCLAAGMNNHLGKPLDFDEVINELRKYLRTKTANV